MSADAADPRGERRAAGRRLSRLAAAALVVGGAWFAIAMSASAQSPSPAAGADASPAASADASPAASADASPTTSPAATLAPSPGASAGPIQSFAIPPVPTPIAHPSDGDANSCAGCHAAVNAKQADITTQWSASAHAKAGVTCADCHGGDPRSDQITVAMDPATGFVGAPDRLQSVGLCGSCHADVERMRPFNLATDQYAKYWTSVHGQRLASAKDVRVATCVDCHGSHDVKKVSDSTAPVFVLNVPKLCASCHADAARMQPYGIPTDQFEIYSKSVHGVALLGNKDVRAPSCASCHGSHDAKPPRDTEVVEVCGKCHTATQELYQQSRHSQLGQAAPKCWTCHGTHDVSQPGSKMFFHTDPPDYDCATCHDLQTHTLRLELDRFKLEADRRCDTCHHPESLIYAQAKGISDALGTAETAYTSAASRIDEAARLGMIVSDADVALTQAKTSLIQAQAAVHTTKLTVIAELSTDARAKAESAEGLAMAKINESTFRRQAMIVVLGLIFINTGFLYLLKRRLDRDLERR